MKQKKNKLALIILLISIFLFLYPSISNNINKRKFINTLKNYTPISKSEYQKLKDYNKNIKQDKYDLISNNKIMGYISIPKIDLILPIYFHSDDKTIKRGVGHIEWSSFPTDGKNIHSLLVSHNGLPGIKLFDDIYKLKEGDFFYIYIYNKRLKYVIDNINIVNPNDTSHSQVINNKNYVSLVTCTPYGINSHRLLVRGELKRTD